ncbi:type I-B CRISPR-associated protein Cas5b [Priestia filamentosa]|uniref:type I-B CRISPR-associated protein Cas5b n=1 Tax=Priestia filamentosa TaxID=1402861 RepID=UPI0005892F87
MTSKAIAFTLRGQFAFFKKPDVNANDMYFTYSHIHKVALLGILGAMLGYKGHRQQDKVNETYPEFYEKLRGLRVSIVPHSPIGYFKKKQQVFNNTVGYANKGATLNVKEQWLEKPGWEIYLLCEDELLYKDILTHLTENLAVYIPYLGKNEHPATIENAREVELEQVEEVTQCSSMLRLEGIDIKGSLSRQALRKRNATPVFLQEVMPTGLSEDTGHYLLETLCFTNLEIEVQENCSSPFYYADNKTISFV